MGSNQTLLPTPSATLTVPRNFPAQPVPGKVQALWEINKNKLWHKFSPYVNYDQNQLFNGFTTQPFYYIYPDQNNQGLNALKKYDSNTFSPGSSAIDVIRVSKFLGSNTGIIFLGKQFLLQTGNAYNETRIYNPSSPIIAAGMGLGLGAIRPQRHFDTSAGLSGVPGTLIGSAIPNALFGAPKINPPSGTIGGSLSDAMMTTGGKGLLRADDANRALAHFQTAWPQTTKGGSLNSTFASRMKNLATSLFANFIPSTQDGIEVRSDEGSYGMMVGGGNVKFAYNSSQGGVFEFGQQWIAGSKTIRKTDQYPSLPYRLFQGANGQPVKVSNANLSGYT